MPEFRQKRKEDILMKNLLKMICTVLAVMLCLSCIAFAEKPETDRAGNAIKLPESAERIISLAPSITQEIIALGLEENLVAVDPYAVVYEPSWPSFPSLT